jgi:uncharacterized protein YebE (UPF0316 family)
LRTIFVARGFKFLAPVLGFFEVSLWLFAIGAVMKNLNDLTCSLAFALGFMVGTYLGIVIEQMLAIGSVGVRTITHKDAGPLVQRLRAAGYGVTCLDAQGATGPVQMIVTIVPRKDLADVTSILKAFDPQIFYAIDPLQSSAAGVTRAARRNWLAGGAWRVASEES